MSTRGCSSLHNRLVWFQSEDASIVWTGWEGEGGEVLADAFFRAELQSVDSCDRRLP